MADNTTGFGAYKDAANDAQKAKPQTGLMYRSFLVTKDPKTGKETKVETTKTSKDPHQQIIGISRKMQTNIMKENDIPKHTDDATKGWMSVGDMIGENENK